MNSFNSIFDKLFESNFNSRFESIIVSSGWNPCEHIYTDKEMIIDVKSTNIGTYYRKHKFDFLLSQKSYRNLALWVLSTVFHRDNDSLPPYQDEGTESRIILENPQSMIKSIRISADNYSRNCNIDSYHAGHVSYTYRKAITGKYPLQKYKAEGESDYLPVFMLGHNNKLDPTELIITGTDLSHIVLAELFLSIAGVDNPLVEYILESDYGVKNLGYSSADAVLRVKK